MTDSFLRGVSVTTCVYLATRFIGRGDWLWAPIMAALAVYWFAREVQAKRKGTS